MCGIGGFEMEKEENKPLSFRFHEKLNITNKQIAKPTVFQDLTWHMGIDKNSQTCSVFLLLENYDSSKSYQVEGFFILENEDGEEQDLKDFKKEFTFEDNKINFPVEISKIEDSDFWITFPIRITVNSATVEVPTPPSIPNKIYLRFPGNRGFYVSRDLLRLNSRYFQDLIQDHNLFNNIFINENMRAFQDLIEILDPANWNKPGQINRNNIAYLMTMAEKYSMIYLMQRCEEALKYSKLISKEEAIWLADQHKLLGVLNPALSRFANVHDIVKFQNMEIYSNLGPATRAAVLKRKDVLESFVSEISPRPTENQNKTDLEHHWNSQRRAEPQELESGLESSEQKNASSLKTLEDEIDRLQSELFMNESGTGTAQQIGPNSDGQPNLQQIQTGQRNGVDPIREAQQNLEQLQKQFAGFQFQRNGADPIREAQQNLEQLQDQFAGFQFENHYQQQNRVQDDRTTAEQMLHRVNEMQKNLQERMAIFRARYGNYGNGPSSTAQDHLEMLQWQNLIQQRIREEKLNRSNRIYQNLLRDIQAGNYVQVSPGHRANYGWRFQNPGAPIFPRPQNYRGPSGAHNFQ